MPVYKNKERGTWYASFWYKNWDGARKKKKKEGFKTKREAQDFEREFIKKQGGGSDMSFGSLVEIYMEDCGTRLRPTTVENKKWLIDTKLLPTFRSAPVNEITPAMVRKWQNDLLDDTAEYAPTYIKTINNQLSAILNYAVRYYGLRSNPAAVAGSIGKRSAEAMQFWTRDEFRRFIVCVEDKPASRLAFEILFWTGMRSGELLALTLNDVDFEKSKISINKTIATVKGKEIISPPKTPKSKRVIAAPRFLLALIRNYIDRLVDYEPNERLFYFTKHLLHDEMKRGCAASGVKKIRIHDLRHSHASMLIEMGYSPLLVCERLGHENIQTTLQTYSHLYPNKQEEVASKLEDDESENYEAVLSEFEKKIETIE